MDKYRVAFCYVIIRIMKKWIDRAVKHYKYDEPIDREESVKTFLNMYDLYTQKEDFRKNIKTVRLCLSGIPNSTHIKAKKLLFQGDEDCWKYFERTAVFLTNGHSNGDWIEEMSFPLAYALYVERKDLIDQLFDFLLSILTNEQNLSDKYFKKQKLYASTQLIHFLLEKWLGYNPVKELVMNYGTGYGIYQKIIDNWEDLSQIDNSYWDELCEYHLKGIGLQRGEKWENEEFLTSGMIPMELINLQKVRKYLGLDVPQIKNELFSTNMAKSPKIPTGYNEDLDVMFQMVFLTIQNQRKYTIEEVVDLIKKKHGSDVQIIF